MSAPKTYLPMLNGLMLGEAISEHDGVCCYPAIRHTNQEKYILKVISVPASQRQLDALLLTGAFPSRESAMEYYMDISRDMLRETEILKQLSQQEGFIPYLDGQIITNDAMNGYEVYLLSNFRHSAERIFATEKLTHKKIIRMGLDLCAALTACRREGYIYVDLKPTNIFYSEEHGFRIGDVGFASMASLAYSSLPDKYRSRYTAPELLDEMAVLNSTVDVYALGLVLYEAYNGGQLPDFEDGNLPAPLYADYTFADIILKACHPDATKRWKDPMALAQAIIAYAQENPVSDTPIIPQMEEEPQTAEDTEEFLPEADPEEIRREMEALIDTDYEKLNFGATHSANSEHTGMTDDHTALPVEDMLAQADELIAHELPEPPIAPDPIDVPMPERIYFDPEPEDTDLWEEIEADEEPQIEPVVAAAIPPQRTEPATPKKEVSDPIIRRQFPWKTVAVTLAIIATICACFGCYYFYQNYYLQTIDELTLDYKGDTVSVKVMTSVDPELLTVVCSDSYGNTMRGKPEAGIAIFRDLDPQTHYTIHLEISGWHKLVGAVTDSFTTDPQTQITLLTAQIGNTDGSVLIHFETSGPAVDNWIISYSSAENHGLPNQIHFQGNTAEIADLAIGTTYVFTLSRADGMALAGQTSVQYTAQQILLAQNPIITRWDSELLSVQWEAPENRQDILWEVHCYNANGYSQRVTTMDLTASFSGMATDVECTVEIYAKDMPSCVGITAPANPITVQQFTCEETEDGMLQITWDYLGEVSAEGWAVVYSMNGSSETELNSDENKITLSLVPGGEYTIRVEAIHCGMQFGGEYSYICPEAEAFNQWGITGDDLTGALCIRPEGDSWTPEDIEENMYTASFTGEQSIAIVLTSQVTPENTQESFAVRYIICDSEGNPISVVFREIRWEDVWNENICALDIPEHPDAAGEYTIHIYINGQYVGQWAFSISESE